MYLKHAVISWENFHRSGHPTIAETHQKVAAANRLPINRVALTGEEEHLFSI